VQQPALDSESDADLLVRYRDGDCAAFRRLVDAYHDRLVQFFFRLSWDRDRAEDLTQELFLKLMRGCQRYRPAGKLSTFVFRVATNLWIDHWRTQRQKARLVSLDLAAHDGPADIAGAEPGPHECAVDDEERCVLRRALATLTEPHRIVFELAVYQERPYGEISDLLHIPVGTIKSRMHNAVHALKALLAAAPGAAPVAAANDGRRRKRRAVGRG
jgi:RNA polymerase sigma-70 factor (ECF subfamily)